MNLNAANSVRLIIAPSGGALLGGVLVGDVRVGVSKTGEGPIC